MVLSVLHCAPPFYSESEVMNELPYRIPDASVTFEEEIKKSRFITTLAHTPGIEMAKQFVTQVKEQHPSARHHCWGFVAERSENSMAWGFSDDGEPSGTAGKPILAQLSGSGVGEICAVVTRYSGGIKLGTGGLVKAYGGGVQQALKLLHTKERRVTQIIKLELDYALMTVVQSLLTEFDAQQVDAVFGARVRLYIELEKRHHQRFIDKVINRSGGKVTYLHQ
jgi:uncharacterized YigZ family protein